MSAVIQHPPLAAAPGWRAHGLALLAVLALVLGLYWPTASSMVGIWMGSETFAHAFVVPPLALWLVWRERARLAAVPPRAVPWVAVVVAGLALVWWAGDLVSVNAVTHLMLMAMLVACVPAVLGWQATRVILFPLLFLFFAVPIGDFLTPLLMQYTADFVVGALRVTGVPVYREGQHLIIPTGHWSVVEACSGIRYLMASTMAGTLFAYLNFHTTSRRLMFVGVSILVPIVANWLRAYIIVMLGHLSNNRIATGVDHLLYGWVFFGIVIMLMFYLGGSWADRQPPAPVRPPRVPVAGDGLAAGTPLVAALVGLAVVLAVPVLGLSRLGQGGPSMAPQLTLPQALPSGAQALASGVPDWAPAYKEPSAQARQIYAAAGGSAVGVHLAYYRDQGGSRKLVNSENALVLSEDLHWNRVGAGRITVDTPAGPNALRTTLLAPVMSGPGAATQPRGDRLRVWQLYWVGGRYTDSDLLAKVYQGLQKLRGQGDDGAAVLLYTLDVPEGSADERLGAFWRQHAGELNTLLTEVQRRR